MFKVPEFPSLDFSGLDISVVRQGAATVRDAAYMTIGLGAVAVERAQARSRRLATTIGQVGDLTKAARQQVLGLLRTAA
jgi:hypothetical protein